MMSVFAASANENITYAYDARGQVVAVERTGTVNDGQSVDITYDDAGNRTNYTSGGAVTTADLSISDAAVVEGDDLVFTVTRAGLTSSAASADYATSDDTALAGTDYTSASGTVSFAVNETSKTVTVATTDDSDIESAKLMTVTLANPSSGTTLATASATGTINDNDTPPTVSVADASAVEGGDLTFTVSLSQASSGTITVDYATADDTASAGTDYTAASGTLTFDPGDTSKTITVSTTDDTTVGSAVAMSLMLSSPSGATIADGAATGTIADNDAVAEFSIDNVTEDEGRTLEFTVTRSGVTTTAVSVSYATVDGTATVDDDYASKSGTLNFSAGQTSKDFKVNGRQDNLPEETETFSVILSNPSLGATIAVGTGVGTIEDDNDSGFAVADASVTEGGALVFTFTRSGYTGSPATIQYETSNGTALAGSDYTSESGSLTFGPGETSKTVSANTTGDSSVESTETMSMLITHVPPISTLLDGTATGTILDND